MNLSAGESVQIPEILPVLSLRDVVIFPHLIMPLAVGREISTRTVQQAMAGDRLLLLVTQKDPTVEEPGEDDLYRMGTAALILRMLKEPDGKMRILVQGLSRARTEEVLVTEPVITAKISVMEEAEEIVADTEQEALLRTVRNQITSMAELGRQLNPDFLGALDTIIDPGRFADLVASNIEMKISDAQAVLEIIDPVERLQHIVNVLTHELELLSVQAKITESARSRISQHQHEYFLREQLKAIQSELGVSDDRSKEIQQLRERIHAAKLPREAGEVAEKELRRLEHMHSDSAEAQIVHTYIDWLASLPWAKKTRDRIDVTRAREILDEDHYGLDEVKDRICEFLAVRKLKPRSKGPILCFVGPPGVGKTSLGRSIARSIGRKFVRISLGGMRDEAEIRGHRRTYVGALPGRIIQMLKQAGANNPVFMLDEIDKLGADFRGDPSSALLEVLDPEQNDSFSDNYLNLPFNLSKVMFITTANLADPIPVALRDRMETIEIPGYTLNEKAEIAFRYLLPRQINENGLQPEHIGFSRQGMEALINGYTREAGLRNLERTIGKICRKIARKVAEGDKLKARVTAGNLTTYLGPVRFLDEEDAIGEERIGLATGLAWTQYGGETLNVEASFVEGKGALSLTGHLGEVMKESAQAALTYARNIAGRFKIDKDFFATHDVHVHVPAGAIPKDGPSAGVTMAVALISAMLQRPTMPGMAMTGEVTLRGSVLPIGGVKEKALAAQRVGIKNVILPAGNKKDMVEIPPQIRRKLDLHFVRTMDEIIELALASK